VKNFIAHLALYLKKRGFLRNHVSRLILLVSIFSLLASHGNAQKRGVEHRAGCRANLEIFTKGEDLTYEVSYLGMALGTIRTRVLRVERAEGKLHVWADGLIRTYRGVPFVTLNTLFQSQIGSSLESRAFRNKEYLRSESVYKHIEYTYDEKNDAVYINETVDDNPQWVRNDTLDLEGKQWQDGLSLLFFARAFAHATCRKEVPVLMYRSKATTVINFGIEREEMDIDAVDDDIRTVKLDGETGFTGIFGLTGGFEGWFSDDSAAVPISAKMHVLIGSVYLELIKWKRPGWSPPMVKD
jgi:hypothetical protein